MSSKVVKNMYGYDQVAYNIRVYDSTKTKEWVLRTKEIKSAELPPLMILSPVAIEMLKSEVSHFLESYKKSMWGDENNHGIYWESVNFRFLRSDYLDENGILVYTGQGYVPSIIVQINLGGTWYDLFIQYIEPE
jgi:hypothetical protein